MRKTIVRSASNKNWKPEYRDQQVLSTYSEHWDSRSVIAENAGDRYYNNINATVDISGRQYSTRE